jgi:hypothetical protein
VKNVQQQQQKKIMFIITDEIQFCAEEFLCFLIRKQWQRGERAREQKSVHGNQKLHNDIVLH